MKAKPALQWMGMGLSLFLVFVIFAVFVLTVLDKVRSGHGLDTFLTPEGAEFNYIGSLILLLLIPISVVVGWGIRYWQLRDERSFKTKYGIKE